MLQEAAGGGTAVRFVVSTVVARGARGAGDGGEAGWRWGGAVVASSALSHRTKPRARATWPGRGYEMHLRRHRGQPWAGDLGLGPWAPR